MEIRIAVLIPLYNHRATIEDVVSRSFCQSKDVFVINDGSTDCEAGFLESLPCRVFHLFPNQGKGVAIREGARKLKALGYTHFVTLDADGQHYPEDLPLFFAQIQSHPESFILGVRDFSTPNVPKSSRFGRSFSQFWCFVQTGLVVHDMQSGYRAYPIEPLLCLHLCENRYSFEIEVLVKAAWAGFAIVEVPVQVFYPEREKRVSHFMAVADNLRITLLNTKLTIRAMTPIPFRCHARQQKSLSLLRPMASLRTLLQESTPENLAFSAACSLFLCTLPLLGFQSILILFAIHSLRLDRLCALCIVPVSWCPVLPAMCLMLGHYVLHGAWLSDFTVQTLAYEAHLRFLEWIVGSFFLAPLLAVFLGGLVYFLAKHLVGGEGKDEMDHGGIGEERS